MRVRFTSPAEDDLESIGDWIAQDDVARASAFVAALRAAAQSLSRHPNRYPRVNRQSGREIRKMTYRRYLIFFRVMPTEVQVVRVLRGSQDWMALLGSNE